MTNQHFSRHGAFKALTGFAILGGALYGFTISPAFSQTTDATPKTQLRPIPDDANVGPDGQLLPPRPADDDNDGPPPPGGPRGQQGRGERGRGPRDGGPDRDQRGPSGPRGERDEARGPEDEQGPHRDGPRGGRDEARGPRDEDGPRRGGPRDERGPRDGGPGPRGPEGALDRAYHGAVELDRYGKLQGDTYNLTGQARDYYNRANTALKGGDPQKAQDLARTSDQLTQAALHLARAENGPLPVPTVAGWTAPPTPKAPKPRDEDAGQPRILEDLNRRLQDVSKTPTNASWVQTARRLSEQAQKDISNKQPEAGRERAIAAMTLLDAADSPKPPRFADAPPRHHEE